MNSVLPIAERIVSDFGGKAGLTLQATHGLADALAGNPASAAQSSLERWTALFRKTCGQEWGTGAPGHSVPWVTLGRPGSRPKARLDRLARHYGIPYDPARPQIVLFALQSWYVFLVKLLLGHVVAAARGRPSPLDEAPTSLSTGRWTGRAGPLVESITSGAMFDALGVTDPWCGEPFRWMVSARSPAWERAVIEAAARSARYDPLAIVAHAAAGGDLLKPLYESLFPRAVRHALGEFYTPAWLAEHVLDQVGYCGQPEARLLDPTCGSGTFLLAALRRWRQGRMKDKGRWMKDERLGMRDEGRWMKDESARRSPLFANPSSLIPDPSSLILRPSSLIVGFDLHPLAVASSRANYLLAIADLLGPDEPIEAPVFARDAILDERADEARFNFVVGNPPWIAWDNLPGDYREATKSHWQRYGLFSLSGNAARHGGGKKDLSMLVLYAAADRYLAPAGRLGMVITQTLFQTKGAGDGFRRFRIGADGPPLRVLRVDDLVDVRPFGDAANWTSVVVLQKGEPTTYPVKYVKWSASGEQGAESGEQGAGSAQYSVLSTQYSVPPPSSLLLPPSSFPQSDLLAQPIDPALPTSPWIVQSRESAVDLALLVGPADYTAHLGANSGGANAVYWLELQGRGACGVRVRNLVGKAKRRVEPVETEIEPGLLYPLVRWIDVDRWSARPSAYLLLAQDPETRAGLEETRFRRDYPRSFDYLESFRPLLAARAAYRRYQDRQPFYSMYNVGPYTLSAAKVIWRRMDRKIRAAVVASIDDPLLGLRPVIPQETCVLIACVSSDEAHYLCALLNSSLVHELVASHSVAGGKGFGTPSILDYLPLRKFDGADPLHVALAALSRRLHASAGEQPPNDGDLAEIDRLARAALVSLRTTPRNPP